MQKKLMLVALAVASAGAIAFSQNSPRVGEIPVAKSTNVEWSRVLYVDFESDKVRQAFETMYGHFHPACTRAGIEPPVVYECATGDWDAIVVFPAEDGPSALEWERTAWHAKWFEAFEELEGGAEQARAVIAAHQAIVQRSSWQIVRRRVAVTASADGGR